MRKRRTSKTVTESEVQEMIRLDPDVPEATDRQLQEALPFASVFPDLAALAQDDIRGSITRSAKRKRAAISARDSAR